MKPVHVRLATRADASSLALVLAESFVEYKSSYTDEAFVATTPRSLEVGRRVDEGPIWVAVRAKTILGTVSGVPHGRAFLVRSLAVSPGNRSQGIGELLLQQVENYANENGYERLFLSTTPFLTSAIRLYERFGFRRSDEGPNNRFGTPIFTMVKELKSKR